ncbi:DUF4190 domain-containing protein [bacterium]|nr:DUF4190 domain-containing protein [bacterium]
MSYDPQNPQSPPPYPPDQGYGYQQPQPWPQQVRTNTMAVMSLVMGILGFFGLGCIGGILAIIFANIADDQIARSQNMETGEGMAKAGRILGWINIILAVVGILIAAVIFLFVIVGAAAAPALSGQ